MSLPTNALTYNGYVTQIGVMAVVPTTTVGGIVQSTDANFNAIIPQMLNYAELRIQRDIDFLQNTTNLAVSVAAGSSYISVDNSLLKTVETVNVFSNSTFAEVTSVLTPASKEFLQNVYPVTTNTANWGLPRYFYLLGNDSQVANYYLYIAPQPASSCAVKIIGTSYMDSLYTYSTTASNAQTGATFISTYLPDLLIMASMIYISAYQRNFGRQSDDPAMAQSYESQYKALLPSASAAELRKNFEASAWSSMAPSAIATPTR